MLELIYLEDDEPREPIEQAILKEFPKAAFEDASDFIHRNRLQVEIPGEDREGDKRAFFRLMAREDLAECCLAIKVALMSRESWVMEELDRLKEEKEANGKA
jgi:hypothetical protein